MRAVSGHGGKPLSSVAQMVIDCVNHTDVDLRKELFAGVVLTGTCLPCLNMACPSACEHLLSGSVGSCDRMFHTPVYAKFLQYLKDQGYGILGVFNQQE
jgi:hypothetical protein